MQSNPYPGKFILGAGYDGSGKDTQLHRLDTVLQAVYPKIKVLRPFPKEPTSGPIGKRIYDILFGRDSEFKLGENLFDFEFQKFFIYDRIDHYRRVIIPALESGINVICNRGLDSTIVYGGNTISEFRRIVNMHEEIFSEAKVPFIWPDLVVVYDVTPETALRRMRASGKKLDGFENEEKARKVTSNYRALAALYPNCKLVDAEPEGEEGEKIIFKDARQYIYPVLSIKDFSNTEA